MCRKDAVHRSDGGSVEGAEGRGVQQLRCEQEGKPIGRPANGEEKQHTARPARHKQRQKRIAPEKRRKKKKHRDLGDYAERPEKADERAAVADALQMQREERIRSEE